MIIKLDSVTGDIAYENGNFVFLDGIDAVVQDVKSRLSTFLGEWFLDTSLGVPYHQQIFVKGTTPTQIDSLIKLEIKNTPGVDEILEYTSDYEDATRDYAISCKIRSQNETALIEQGI